MRPCHSKPAKARGVRNPKRCRMFWRRSGLSPSRSDPTTKLRGQIPAPRRFLQLVQSLPRRHSCEYFVVLLCPAGIVEPVFGCLILRPRRSQIGQAPGLLHSFMATGYVMLDGQFPTPHYTHAGNSEKPGSPVRGFFNSDYRVTPESHERRSCRGRVRGLGPIDSAHRPSTQLRGRGKWIQTLKPDPPTPT